MTKNLYIRQRVPQHERLNENGKFMHIDEEEPIKNPPLYQKSERFLRST